MKEFEIILGISISIIIVIIAFFIFIKEIYRRLRIRKRLKRAKVGEKEAEEFLIKNGYKILGNQVEIETKILVNNKLEKIKVVPDYYVSKGFKKYYAEVKTGKSAIKIQNRNTRRQILEYSYISSFRPVLLIDMENRKITKIEFSKFNTLNIPIILVLIIISIVLLYLYMFTWIRKKGIKYEDFNFL